MQARTRAQAIALGQITYFTGKPCRRGHVADRYTMAGNCRECAREAGRAELARIRQLRKTSAAGA
jgi:hypothetical protein